MNKIFLFFLFTFSYSYGQDFQLLETDTINYNYRSSSNKIDSLDYYHTASTSLNAGGSFYHPFGPYQQSYTYFFPLLDNAFIPFKSLKVKYTVLPHLGFIYSTGSSGIQFMHTDFQHLLNKNTLLNFNFEVNSLGNLLRNGDFRNSYVDLLLFHMSKKISNDLIFRYYQSKMSLNSGLYDTSLVNTQHYSLQNVQNENSNSLQKSANLSNQFSFNFLKDSLNFFGFTYLSEWQIRHREYNESGDISATYSTIYIDSFQTRDQYQLASFSNGIGIKFINKNFKSEILTKYKYWDLQNLSQHHDTNEMYLDIKFEYNKNRIRFLSLNEINFLGALGQIKSQQKLEWKNNKFKLSLFYLFHQYYPLAEQRFYYSNNYSWHKNKFQLQTLNQFAISSFYEKNKFNILLKFSLNQLNNKYFFNGKDFVNDTLNNLTFISFAIKSSYHFSLFGIQPYFAINSFPSDFSYAPQIDSRLRFFFNKKMFKSKKLDFLLGIDLSYIASHQLFSYQRALGIYSINNSNSKSNEFFGLDFYTGFQINVFRFYFKVEKIDYFWSKRNQWDLSKVPIAPMLFRLGLTWDFFN